MISGLSLDDEAAAKIEQLRESMPVHYFDCDRFETYSYGTRQGKCDCSANDDVAWLLDRLVEAEQREHEARTEAAEQIARAVTLEDFAFARTQELAAAQEALQRVEALCAEQERLIISRGYRDGCLGHLDINAVRAAAVVRSGAGSLNNPNEGAE